MAAAEALDFAVQFEAAPDFLIAENAEAVNDRHRALCPFDDFIGRQLQIGLMLDGQYDGINSWHLITSEVDRNVATVADVHTSFGSALEEAVGYAYRIYVVVPDPRGGLQVTKGGVFSYYEFTHPSDDRLTDEKWREMLDSGQAPRPPQWTSSFMAGK